MKKFVFSLLAVLGLSIPAFAAGEGDVGGFGTIATKLTAWVESITAAIETWFSTNWDNLLIVLGIALGLVVVWTVYRFIAKGVRKVG